MSNAKALAAELAALVDLLVPGDGEFPAASAIGVRSGPVSVGTEAAGCPLRTSVTRRRASSKREP